MKHIVLLGDSIFDNGSYVGYNELDVPNQLKSLVNNDCKVTNLAVDGHVTSHIVTQLNNLPSDATHLFVSVGGNDALGHLSILNEPIPTIGDAFQKMYLIGENFQKAYSEMLDSVLVHKLPTTVCSVYYPRFTAQSLNRVQLYLPQQVNAEQLQQRAGTLTHGRTKACKQHPLAQSPVSKNLIVSVFFMYGLKKLVKIFLPRKN